MPPALRALENGEPLRSRDPREPCMREFGLAADDAAEQFERGGSVLDSRKVLNQFSEFKEFLTRSRDPRTEPAHRVEVNRTGGHTLGDRLGEAVDGHLDPLDVPRGSVQRNLAKPRD